MSPYDELVLYMLLVATEPMPTYVSFYWLPEGLPF